jgi:Rieske Fe-S protein
VLASLTAAFGLVDLNQHFHFLVFMCALENLEVLYKLLQCISTSNYEYRAVYLDNGAADIVVQTYNKLCMHIGCTGNP